MCIDHLKNCQIFLPLNPLCLPYSFSKISFYYTLFRLKIPQQHNPLFFLPIPCTPFHAILPIVYPRTLSPLFYSLSLLFLQILFYFPIHINFLKHFSYFALRCCCSVHNIFINNIGSWRVVLLLLGIPFIVKKWRVSNINIPFEFNSVCRITQQNIVYRFKPC